jgi:hypothetical protein
MQVSLFLLPRGRNARFAQARKNHRMMVSVSWTRQRPGGSQKTCSLSARLILCVELSFQFCYAQSMQITINLPDDMPRLPNPARAVLEACAIEGYRSGALSSYQTRLLLSFETRQELDGFLKLHEVWEHAYSIEELEKDRAGFERAA